MPDPLPAPQRSLGPRSLRPRSSGPSSPEPGFGSTRSLSIDVTLHVSAPAWRQALPGLDGIARRALDAALAHEQGALDVAVVFADDSFVQGLNARFRGKDKPTNVLSFPSTGSKPGDASRALGDIILPFETVNGEAQRAGTPLADHLAHLLVHGALHLVGYDHMSDEDTERMTAAEISALARLGLPDPYVRSETFEADASRIRGSGEDKDSSRRDHGIKA